MSLFLFFWNNRTSGGRGDHIRKPNGISEQYIHARYIRYEILKVVPTNHRSIKKKDWLSMRKLWFYYLLLF